MRIRPHCWPEPGRLSRDTFRYVIDPSGLARKKAGSEGTAYYGNRGESKRSGRPDRAEDNRKANDRLEELNAETEEILVTEVCGNFANGFKHSTAGMRKDILSTYLSVTDPNHAKNFAGYSELSSLNRYLEELDTSSNGIMYEAGKVTGAFAEALNTALIVTGIKGAAEKAAEVAASGGARTVKMLASMEMVTTTGQRTWTWALVEVEVAETGVVEAATAVVGVTDGEVLLSRLLEEDAGNGKGTESNTPEYKKEDRVPLDKETVLKGKDYQKTGKNVKGAQVYKKGNQYYYRDTFHTGESAHLEVFDKWGKHLGEADPLTGILRPGTADPTKTINIK